MDDPILFLIGAAIVAISAGDFLVTSISMAGLGRVSGWIVAGTSAGLRWLNLRFGRPPVWVVGPAIMSCMALFWIVANLVGYMLMFLAGPSLVAGDTGRPASAVETAAYAGSTLSTLGDSTVGAASGWWGLLAVVAAVHGMVVLTLSVSFVMNTLTTVARVRAFALRVDAAFEAGTHHGDDAAKDALTALGPELCRIAVDLDAAPVPAHFVSMTKDRSFSYAVMRLCDFIENAPESRFLELRRGLAALGGPVGDSNIEETRKWAERRYAARREEDEENPDVDAGV